MEGLNLTHLGDLSYTARRAAGCGIRGAVVYWKEKDNRKVAEAMAELGITSMTIARESRYVGDVDKLRPYIENKTLTLRHK